MGPDYYGMVWYGMVWYGMPPRQKIVRNLIYCLYCIFIFCKSQAVFLSGWFVSAIVC